MHEHDQPIGLIVLLALRMTLPVRVLSHGADGTAADSALTRINVGLTEFDCAHLQTRTKLHAAVEHLEEGAQLVSEQEQDHQRHNSPYERRQAVPCRMV